MRVERAAAGAWSLTKPFEAAADPSSAEAAASQVSALRILTRLDLEADMVDRHKITEAPRQVLDLDDGFTHGLPR